MQPNKISVLLADDHQLVREGLRKILDRDQSIHIIAETRDGLQTVHACCDLRPDVLVLDLGLPKLHGLEVLNALKDRKRPRCIVVTMHGDEASVMEAFRLGAAGYLLKESPATELIRAIKEVHNGSSFVDEALQPMVKSAMVRNLERSKPEKAQQLTRREQFVLQLAAQGNPNAAVAKIMGISTRTVEKHRSNLMKKTGLRSDAELVLFALRKKLIPS